MTQVNGIAVWADGIKAELAQRLPGQRKTQRDKLAVLVATMLHVRSANLVELAAGLPREPAPGFPRRRPFPVNVVDPADGTSISRRNRHHVLLCASSQPKRIRLKALGCSTWGKWRAFGISS